MILPINATTSENYTQFIFASKVQCFSIGSQQKAIVYFSPGQHHIGSKMSDAYVIEN